MTTSRPQQDAFWLERLQRDGPSDADHGELARALSPSLALLRAGRYWEAHETLEDLWRETPYPLRLFHYALIKVAVGLLHVEQRSPAPAERQLEQASRYLEPFTPAFAGLDTAAVLAQVRARLVALTEGATPDWDAIGGFAFLDAAEG